MKKIITAFTFFLLFFPIHAEILETTVGVGGIVCTSCVTAIQLSFRQVKNKAIKPIEDKDINIGKGKITVSFKEGNTFTLAKLEDIFSTTITKATYKFGAIKNIMAKGYIKKGTDGLYLQISNTKEQIHFVYQEDSYRLQKQKKKSKKSLLAKLKRVFKGKEKNKITRGITKENQQKLHKLYEQKKLVQVKASLYKDGGKFFITKLAGVSTVQ